MFARIANLLDDRLDAVAAPARHMIFVRIAIALVAAVLTGAIFDPMTGALWGVVYAVGELLTRITSSPVDRGRPMSRRRRAIYVAALFGQASIWLSLAVIYWTTGEEPFRLAAMAVIVGLLIHAQAFSFRSPLALIALGGPPALMWMVLPVAFGGYEGVQAWPLAVGLAMALAYVAASARANVKTSASLEAAERDAVAANEAKSHFLAVMSHELRTPLNGVLGMARALQRTTLDSRQTSQVATIVRAGEGLLEMLNDVLDIAKIEAGRLDLDVGAFDLRALADHVCDLWSETAAGKGLSLSVEADPDLPPWLLGDQGRVRQILINLVSNALKFTEAGGVRIVLRPAPGADGDGGAEIVVSDTGIGITPEQSVRLFRPYVQAEPSTANRHGGTGLGLSICRNLCTVMGGNIRLESPPGGGASFRVWLPLPAAEALIPATSPIGSLPALRILVADDNPINQAVARAILEAAGAVVETAGDGAQALERLRIEAFDVVLMDVHMPVMDGIEAVQRLRDGQAGRSDVPIIALTADAMDGEAERLKRQGFDALQPKPVQPTALIEAILQVVGERRIPAAQADVA